MTASAIKASILVLLQQVELLQSEREAEQQTYERQLSQFAERHVSLQCQLDNARSELQQALQRADGEADKEQLGYSEREQQLILQHKQNLSALEEQCNSDWQAEVNRLQEEVNVARNYRTLCVQLQQQLQEERNLHQAAQRRISELEGCLQAATLRHAPAAETAPQTNGKEKVYKEKYIRQKKELQQYKRAYYSAIAHKSSNASLPTTLTSERQSSHERQSTDEVVQPTTSNDNSASKVATDNQTDKPSVSSTAAVEQASNIACPQPALVPALRLNIVDVVNLCSPEPTTLCRQAPSATAATKVSVPVRQTQSLATADSLATVALKHLVTPHPVPRSPDDDLTQPPFHTPFLPQPQPTISSNRAPIHTPKIQTQPSSTLPPSQLAAQTLDHEVQTTLQPLTTSYPEPTELNKQPKPHQASSTSCSYTGQPHHCQQQMGVRAAACAFGPPVPSNAESGSHQWHGKRQRLQGEPGRHNGTGRAMVLDADEEWLVPLAKSRARPTHPAALPSPSTAAMEPGCTAPPGRRHQQHFTTEGGGRAASGLAAPPPARADCLAGAADPDEDLTQPGSDDTASELGGQHAVGGSAGHSAQHSGAAGCGDVRLSAVGRSRLGHPHTDQLQRGALTADQPPPQEQQQQGGAQQHMQQPGGNGSGKGGGFKYSDVVRNKAQRADLAAVECACCKAFYAALVSWDPHNMPALECGHAVKAAGGGQQQPAPALAAAVREEGSRHRFRYAPPATPEGFWDLGFNDTLDSRVW